MNNQKDKNDPEIPPNESRQIVGLDRSEKAMLRQSSK